MSEAHNLALEHDQVERRGSQAVDDEHATQARRAPQYGEYWKPAISDPDRDIALRSESCAHCGSDFAVGARFCHVCGADRTGLATTQSSPFWSWTRALDLEVLKNSLGLSLGAIICFFVGMACTVAAITVGFIYTATTLLDWQAVQMWRVEWLLAAIAAFVAGILLKK